MARRSRRDRVVGYPAAGGSRYVDPSGTLPRSTYRDVEALSSSFAPFVADFRTGVPARRMTRIVSTPVSLYKHAKRSEAVRLISPKSYYLREIPSRVRFCVSRKIRREALFAFGRAGFRGSAPKRHYRRVATSNYRC